MRKLFCWLLGHSGFTSVDEKPLWLIATPEGNPYCVIDRCKKCKVVFYRNPTDIEILRAQKAEEQRQKMQELLMNIYAEQAKSSGVN